MPRQVSDNEVEVEAEAKVVAAEALIQPDNGQSIKVMLEKTKRQLEHFEKRYKALNDYRQVLLKRRGQVYAIRKNPLYSGKKFENKFRDLSQYVAARERKVQSLQADISKHQFLLQQKEILKAKTYGLAEPTMAQSEYNDGFTRARSEELRVQQGKLAASQAELDEKARFKAIIDLKSDPFVTLLELNNRDLIPVTKRRSDLLKRLNFLEKCAANMEMRDQYQQYAVEHSVEYNQGDVEQMIERCNLMYAQTMVPSGKKTTRKMMSDVRQFSIGGDSSLVAFDVLGENVVVATCGGE